jgi:hypothetical protein
MRWAVALILTLAMHGPRVAPAFRPALGQLARSPIPVYLPSWIPALHVQVFAVALTFAAGYSAALSTCRQAYGSCVLLSVGGETAASASNWFTVSPHTRQLTIRPGVVGYRITLVGAAVPVRLEWYEHGETFSLACATARGMCTDAQFVHVARSMIHVR